jgi:uncharacterized MAPEG superfamily protein
VIFMIEISIRFCERRLFCGVGVCSFAVLYQGRLAICGRLSDPAPTHLVQWLLLNQLAVICYIGNEDIVRSLVAQGNDVNAED